MKNKPTYKELEEEIKLLKNESSSKVLLDLAGVLFIKIDTKGLVTLANKKACETLGYEESEIVGKNWFENFLPERFKKKIITIAQKLLSEEIDEYYENPILTKDGNERIIFWHSKTIKNETGSIIAHLSSGKDITEQKHAELELIQKNLELQTSEEELRSANDELQEINTELKIAIVKAKKSDTQFRAISEQTSEGITLADKEGNYVFVNPAFCKMTGYSIKEILKMKIFEMLVKPENIIIDENLFGIPIEYIVKRKDNSTFPIQIIINPIKIGDDNLLLGIITDITEKKHTHRKLLIAKERAEKNEAKYKNRFEYFPFPTFIWQEKDNDFIMISANKKAYNESNGKVKNIFGVKSKVLWSGEPELTEYLNRCFETQKTFSVEREHTFRASGSKQFISATYSFLPPNNVQIITVDITDRKTSENELINQKNLFETMFNSINDGVVITDTKRKIILANKGMKNTFDYLSDEIIGKTTELLYADSGKYTNTGKKRYNKDSVSSDNIYVTHYKKKDGTVFLGETFGIKLFDNENNWIGNLGIMRDISEREKFVSELKAAKEKAEESDRLKTEFLNNMSHEIRTPMNGILGFSNFLNNPNITKEKSKHFVSIIQNSSKQLLRIIDDILEISILETKQLKIIEKPICLNDLLLELFAIFDIKAKENRTALYLKKGLSDIDSTILSDKSKLDKILSNLLENALKFTNNGFIEFGYNIKKTHNTEFLLEIYVKDTGIGIKEEKQETIFKRFSQEEKELSQKVGGLGLGLSIAKENAELLGGKITLESEKGKGSTFFVTVPYKPAQKSINTLNSSDYINENISNQKKYLILIVEDEEVNYLYLETLLEAEIKINCDIIHAKNGLEAIEICKQNANIDIILMDLKMPIMNGYEATMQIRKFRPNLPIIAQTAYSTVSDREKAISAGCNDFISKPIAEKKLTELLNLQLK